MVAGSRWAECGGARANGGWAASPDGLYVVRPAFWRNQHVDEGMKRQPIPAALGRIQPHASLLTVPPEGQLLYKIMTINNLLRSISGSYLHFNRVNSYTDFTAADPHDGQQFPKDLQSNAKARFQKAPEFSAAHYYDQSRARTYACCLFLENSDFIWKNYVGSSVERKVCIVFEFGKLRTTLNQVLQPGNAVLEANGNRCHQIFSVNYGVVEYVEWDRHQANEARLPNPIKYTYLKDRMFSEEKEVRVSLSALGIGKFVLNDGSTIDFPPSLHVAFDFRRAISDGTIRQVLYAADCDYDFVCTELTKLGIVPSFVRAPPLNR